MQRKRLMLEDELFLKQFGEDYQDLLPDNTPVDKLFNQDAHAKKAIAVSSRVTRRRGFDGTTVLTPTSFMKKEERKNLNGKVVYSNFYQDTKNIPLYCSFEKKTKAEQEKILSKFLQYFSVKSIANKMRIRELELITLIKEYKIELPETRTEEVIKLIERVEEAMNEEIMSYEQFKECSNKEERIKIILDYIQTHGKKALSMAWGGKNLANMVRNLHIQDLVRDPNRKPIIRESKKATVEDIEKIVKKENKRIKPETQSMYSLTELKLTGENLAQRLEGLSHIIMADSDYIVTVVIKELIPIQEEGM
jgi:cell fate (sporulation/competence/biofilm development) regulator YmcA (YheA/YmcA/DUF963 family)